ncbi:MAG: hypothetical protein COC24_000300 [Alphaproteobacteria bacterium]|nr:hypothetical protein [Alphaproteobacteria bacterium]
MSKYLKIAPLLLIAVIFIYFSTLANLDLVGGRYSLFMDELVTYDGVFPINHPDGLLDFLWNVYNGGDHRYGRVVWNSMAIFSFIPDLIFGEQGQIIAGRMLQVLLLITAFWLLTVTFVKQWVLRFILFAALLAIPFGSYYATMPKPEPIQLLFTAIFLYFFNKNSMKLDSKYWIFIGLAFGAKISLFPIILFFVFIAMLQSLKNNNLTSVITKTINTFAYFLIGLALAVPILIPTIFSSIFAYKILIRPLHSKIIKNQILANISLIGAIFTTALGLAGLLYLKGFKPGLAYWGGSTFLNTGHGADSSSINIFSWVNYFINDWMIAPAIVSIIFASLSALIVFIFIGQKFKEKNFIGNLTNSVPLVIFIGGTLLNLAIFLATHRLWGSYLFLGSSLMLTGIVAIIEVNLTRSFKFKNLASYIWLLLTLTITLLWWAPNSYKEFSYLSDRTKNDEFVKSQVIYQEISQFLSDLSTIDGNTLDIAFDPKLFLPNSTETYKITRFWGHYLGWQEKADVIIYSADHLNETVLDTNVNFDKYNQEIEFYKKYVIEKSQLCELDFCYMKHTTLSDNGEILVLTTQN